MDERGSTTFFIVNHQQVAHEAQLIADLAAVPGCKIERVPVANDITQRLTQSTGKHCVIFNANRFDSAAFTFIEGFTMLVSPLPIIIQTATVDKDLRKRIRKLKHLVLLEGPYVAATLRELSEKVIKGEAVYQRSHDRYPTDQAVEIEVLASKATHPASMRNMSRGGAYFEIDAEATIEEGEFLKVTIQLDKLSRAHQVYGEVMRYRHDGGSTGKAAFGIRYVSSDELFNALQDKSNTRAGAGAMPTG